MLLVTFIGGNDELPQVVFCLFDPFWITDEVPLQTVTNNRWLVFCCWTTPPGVLGNGKDFSMYLVKFPVLVELICCVLRIRLAVEGLRAEFMPLFFGSLKFLFLLTSEGLDLAIIGSLREDD